jgi:hypothetical protein
VLRNIKDVIFVISNCFYSEEVKTKLCFNVVSYLIRIKWMEHKLLIVS